MKATFPVTVGPDLTFDGGRNAFVAEVNAAGTALAYAGYIGGGYDEGLGIAVDGSGNAYVTGLTTSDENSFPVTVGMDLTFNGGVTDAFVVKIGVDADTTPPTATASPSGGTYSSAQNVTLTCNDGGARYWMSNNLLLFWNRVYPNNSLYGSY